jgi:uncharacterized protein YfaS (alpha-2-macroglobulin family)
VNRFDLQLRRRTRILTPGLVYAAIIAAAFFVADQRIQRATAEAQQFNPVTDDEPVDVKPFFSLSTNRTYGTSENARLWLDHRGIESLDFRVYRVNDPQKFFAQLSNPHQMGEDEQEEVAPNISRKPSALERVRAVKGWVYSGIRNYFRDQLKENTRVTFNHKFRAAETATRTPLNVADYARVPLLNPSQLVTAWREPLPALSSYYDRRMIPLGKRESGVYLVEAVGGNLRAYTIVVVTDLATVEKASRNGELLVYAVDRKTGEPRADARVEIVKSKNTLASGRTNSDGIFRTKIAPQQDEVDSFGEERSSSTSNFVIFASHGDNFAISDLESFYFNHFDDDTTGQNVQGYIYTDRPIYRPNHKVFFKGILRGIDEKQQYRPIKDNAVHVTIYGGDDARVFDQELPLSKNGTFNGELTLAEEAPLGTYRIEAETEEGAATGNFDVAEYKKPEYKVSVATPHKFAAAGTKTKFTIDARYFFGAPVVGADVKYYIYRHRYYTYFGENDESYEDQQDEEQYARYGNYYSEFLNEGEGKLDASGHFEIDFEVPQSQENDVTDFQYRVEAQITDASRRTIDGSATLVATRGSVIASAMPDRYVFTQGQTARITVKTTDYEGHPVPARLTLKFVAPYTVVETTSNGSQYTWRENDLSAAEISTDQQGHAIYDYQATTPGSVSIKTVVEEKGKQFATLGGYLYVVSPESRWTDLPEDNESMGAIKLEADKKSYRAGETAHVLAILPEENANLLVTTERDNVLSAWMVKATGKTALLDVPVEKQYAPNVFLSVTFVKDGDMFMNDKRLIVPARDKVLNLEIISNKEEYKPRETASYTILARDADGAPVPDAEISLGVVDEAIYSVSPDYSGNIRQQFYGMRYNSVETHLSVSYSFRGFAGEKPIDLASTKPSYQLADFKNEGELAQPAIRKEFKDTAFWQPGVVTGRDGRATVSFKLPDNLTTWRATARGVTADTKVGVARQKVISRKDVIMRLETPRFFTQGDTVTLSGIVHNYLKENKSTQISLSVSGARLISPAQQTVTIPRQGEQRIDWQISAPQTGEVRLLAKALTNTESDAVELAIDVVPRGLHEVKADRWTTNDENAQQEFTINMPANTDLNSRKLRIEASPSVAATLFGALDYLTSYPYGCTEQTMSSFLPNIIVSQTLKEFKSTSIRNSNELKKKVERGRNRLYGFQHQDGGWGWWKDDNSDPFMTAYVIDGLTLAKQAGYEIDEGRLARGRERLQGLLDSMENNEDLDTRTFMIYALAESGGVDSRYLEKLFADRNILQPYGRALLALTLSLVNMDQRAQEVAAEIERSAKVDHMTAHWESKRPPRLDFTDYDQTEGTALSLKALTRLKPDSPLLPQAARWLVSERPNGWFWNSTKDTAFGIFGLIEYVKVSRELSPEYNLEVYMNGETVVSERVSEANGTQTFVVNRKGGEVGETNHVRVVKRGKGTLYFSTSVDYYTNDENVAARGSGDLNIAREYLRLKVETMGYNLRWVTEPLTGEIRSGDLIVVKLHVTGKEGRHMMIEDPIPSGAEQMDAVGNLILNWSQTGWTDWYSSREFRDRRTVFFLDHFDGDATFQYAMRVQIPGEFVVAPARVELMYHPDTNSNTASHRFSFTDRQ